MTWYTYVGSPLAGRSPKPEVRVPRTLSAPNVGAQLVRTIYLSVYIYMRVHIYIYIYTYTYIHVYIYIYNVYISLSIYIYIYILLLLLLLLYVYIYTHIPPPLALRPALLRPLLVSAGRCALVAD